MAEEAWLSGKLDGYYELMMPAAHALTQAANELAAFADLDTDGLYSRPNGVPSIAFHLKHIAGSVDRLLTYAKGGELSEGQLMYLEHETTANIESAETLVGNAVKAIHIALAACRTVPVEHVFDERFVGRKKLPTTVFGLLFHIAEHTARHVGQITTTAKFVRKSDGNSLLSKA